MNKGLTDKSKIKAKVPLPRNRDRGGHRLKLSKESSQEPVSVV